MPPRPLCPECGSPDVHLGDAVAACNACGYWGSPQHFFAHVRDGGECGRSMPGATPIAPSVPIGEAA